MNKMYCEHCGHGDGETIKMWARRTDFMILEEEIMPDSHPVPVRLTKYGWNCPDCVKAPDHGKVYDASTGMAIVTPK